MRAMASSIRGLLEDLRSAQSELTAMHHALISATERLDTEEIARRHAAVDAQGEIVMAILERLLQALRAQGSPPAPH